MRFVQRPSLSAVQPPHAPPSSADAHGQGHRPRVTNLAGYSGITTISTVARGIASAMLAVAVVLFATWRSDYWLLRDRLVHITDALFGTYIPPPCRKDASLCVKDHRTGPLMPQSRPPDVLLLEEPSQSVEVER